MMLTLINLDVKESESHFSKNQQNSDVLAIFTHYNNPFGSVTQHWDETFRFHYYSKFELWSKTILAPLSKAQAKVNAKRKLFLSNWSTVNVSLYGCIQVTI